MNTHTNTCNRSLMQFISKTNKLSQAQKDYRCYDLSSGKRKRYSSGQHCAKQGMNAAVDKSYSKPSPTILQGLLHQQLLKKMTMKSGGFEELKYKMYFWLNCFWLNKEGPYSLTKRCKSVGIFSVMSSDAYSNYLSLSAAKASTLSRRTLTGTVPLNDYVVAIAAPLVTVIYCSNSKTFCTY